MSTMWQGEGSVAVDGGVLTCVYARLSLLELRPGDVVELTPATGGEASEHRLLQVDSDEVLTYDGNTPAGEYLVRIKRQLEKPCPVCEKDGAPSESDHLHCNTCKAKVGLGLGRVNCEGCIAKMRKRLMKGGRLESEVNLFGGKRKILIHSRTVAEADQLQEYQERLILSNPNQTTQYVLDETRRAAVALTLDDDGTGQSPKQHIKDPASLSPADQLTVMVKHFKGMTGAYFNALLSAVAIFDSLVEDACKGDVVDDVDDAGLMALGEALAIGPSPIGEVKVWDGQLALLFGAPSTDELDDANAFAENFIQASKEHMLDGRAKFIIALARLAAHFRGDAVRTFDENSTFDERLDYLLQLPIAMYYVYQDAAIVWQRRMAKASEVEILGNS